MRRIEISVDPAIIPTRVTTTREKWPRLADFEEAIKDRIVQRTGGRIQSLQVESNDGRVLVRGRVASFHLKQLAIQGVLDVTGPGSTIEIQLDIEVGSR